jgi:hypothetical protein
MKDRPLIVVGLVVGLVLLTFPLWYPAVAGSAVPAPEPKVPEGKCVEGREYMRAHHMELLDQWRDDVVRKGKKNYVSQAYGTTYEMSLTRTCLDCHAGAETVSASADHPEVRGPAFCLECHDYADVEVTCWECHLEP